MVIAYEPLTPHAQSKAGSHVFAASILSMAAWVLGQHPGENTQPEHKVNVLLFKIPPVRDPLILFPLTVKIEPAVSDLPFLSEITNISQLHQHTSLPMLFLASEFAVLPPPT